MRVLITGATTSLGQALSDGLAPAHLLRLSDRDGLETQREFVPSELGHDESTGALVEDIEAIVHLAYAPRPGDSETEWIDHNSRRTYNLLWAAAKAGVKHVVVVSTLDLFAPYDSHLTVSENWKPLPSCDPAILGAHLCEFTAREFAHSRALPVTVVRLGHLVHAEEVEGQSYDPVWVDIDDAVRAIGNILDKITAERDRPYGVVHIQSDSPRARFSVAAAKSRLEFAPEQNFEANP